MRLGARGKLFLVTVALLFASLAASEIYLLPTIEHDLTDRIRQDLYVRLQLVAERAATYAQTTAGPADWDALAHRLGALAQARVTFVQADGRVVGDSEVPGKDLGAHSLRLMEKEDATLEGTFVLFFGGNHFTNVGC